MSYSELIKNFERIRDYMRQFYVYGFKSRGEYDAKSARSYDNERRRIESWLGDYMAFRQDTGGKNVFLALDSRAISHNPLYKAFKAKSFTDNDITLHFYILDLLTDGQALSVREIAEQIATHYLAGFDEFGILDESTVRKKLKEYETLGLLKSEKCGRELRYSRTAAPADFESWHDVAAFFSEADPLGIVGSYLLDQYGSAPGYFGFKHHYILHVLDSQMLCKLVACMGEKRGAELLVKSRRSEAIRLYSVYPMKIYISTQTGRQYLLAYSDRLKKPLFFRMDSIREVKPGAVEKNFSQYDGYFEKFRENLWGVSTGVEYSLDHLEMIVHVGKGEQFILNRLEREKRCGRVEAIDDHTYRFLADVYDATEMLPWVRTFIGRILRLECSNSYVTDTFYADLEAMRRMYGGETDAL